jgi:hypothetical protein
MWINSSEQSVEIVHEQNIEMAEPITTTGKHILLHYHLN